MMRIKGIVLATLALGTILVGSAYHVQPLGAATIRERLVGKDAHERASLITDEMILRFRPITFTSGEYTVQLVSAEKITDGIQVTARAWRNGVQIGFGADGSVDIERFRIFFPQYTVEDPTGDVVTTGTRSDGTSYTVKEKEDVIQALKNDLIHTIRVAGKEGATITPGKIGNTTDTYNPAAGTGGTSVDGYLYVSDAANWDTAHDAGASTVADTATGDDWFVTVRTNSSLTRMARAVYIFPTDGLPDTDVISSATLSIYITGKQNADNDGNDFVSIVSSNPALTNNLSTGDFDLVGDAINNPTEMHDTGQRKDITGVSTSAYLDWTLNASGIANISKTGVSKFGAREGHDILDDPFTDSTSYNYLTGRFADAAGGTPPKLVVVHAAGGTPVPSQDYSLILE